MAPDQEELFKDDVERRENHFGQPQGNGKFGGCDEEGENADNDERSRGSLLESQYVVAVELGGRRAYATKSPGFSRSAAVSPRP